MLSSPSYLSLKEQQFLQAQVNKTLSDSSIELEARFGCPIKKYGYDKHKITREQFSQLLSGLQTSSDYKMISEPQISLDVRFCHQKQCYQSIRMTMNGKQNIKTYCQRNKLSEIPDMAILFKQAVLWNDTEQNNLRQKYKHTKLDTDIGIRSSLNYEVPLQRVIQEESSSQIIQLTIHEDAELSEECKQIVTKAIEDINELQLDLDKAKKVFRYKKRYQFQMIDYPEYCIDLTILKTSATNHRHTLIPHRSLLQSGIFNNGESFEVEMEYTANRKQYQGEKTETMLQNEFINRFSHSMTNIYQLMYKKQPFSLQLEQQVLQSYSYLVLENRIQRAKKINQLMTEYYGYLEANLATNKKWNQSAFVKYREYINKQNKYLSGYKNQIQKGYTSRINFSKNFVGPKSITLVRDNLFLIGTKENPNKNILNGYCITDKADGIRMSLYINNRGQTFLVGSQGFVRYLPIQFSSDEYHDIIIDGEYIESLDQFYAFDVYFINGQSIQELPLLWNKTITKTDTRYYHLQQIMNKINQDKLDQLSKCKIKCKEYFWSETAQDNQTTIFHKFQQCWEQCQNKPYEVDGLILTPCFVPVGYQYKIKTEMSKLPMLSAPTKEILREKGKYGKMIADINFLKKIFRHNALQGAWMNQYKWKPPQHNSIDFFVEYKRDSAGDILEAQFNSGENSGKTYRILQLYVGTTKDYKYYQSQEPCLSKQQLQKKVTRSKQMTIKEKQLFRPYMNSHKKINEARVMINPDTGDIVRNDGSTIQIRDKSVVECVYDPTDSEYCWKVLRNRAEKTRQYDVEMMKIMKMKRGFNSHKHKIEQVVNHPKHQGIPSSISSIIRKLKTHSDLKPIWNYYHFGNVNEIRFHHSLQDIFGKGTNRLRIQSVEDFPIHFNYGNYYTTANNVWNSILHPILDPSSHPEESWIASITKESIKDMEFENIYYKPLELRSSSSTYTMQKFHNFVKKTILQYCWKKCHSLTLPDNSSRTSKDLLDMACGKGSDLLKWSQTYHQTKDGDSVTVHRIQSVVGIDSNPDNIFNQENGACVRDYSLQTSAKANGMPYPDTQFLVGDVSMRLQDRNAYSNLFPEHSPYKNYHTENLENSQLIENTKYKMISCNFALHYLIENIDRVFQNVDSLLMPGGMFMGTFMNGKKVFSLFQKEAKQLSTTFGKTINEILTNSMTIRRADKENPEIELWNIEKPEQSWTEELSNSQCILWNGPLGVTEFDQFAKGSYLIMKYLSTLSKVITIIGGGDTAACCEQFQLQHTMSHVSTGGGASLSILEGKQLPGIKFLSS